MRARIDKAGQDRQAQEPASRQRPHGDAAADAASPRQLQQRQQITQLQRSAPGADRGGLPAPLRSGIEALSGMDMSGVRVHRNSDKPAALQAHAYAQGSDIHLGPGQDKQLPHEAWHVVQQAQGRVKPTLRTPDGVPVNDSPALEHEADRMGSHALAAGSRTATRSPTRRGRTGRGSVLQGAWHWNALDAWWEEDEGFVYDPAKGLWHMNQADEADEEPEFDANDIAGFKMSLLNTMDTGQALAYFGAHMDDVGMMRDYIAGQVAARPGNDEIEKEGDNEELFDENDLAETEKNAAFSEARAVPVATTTEEGESVNSAGASTCVIVFLRAESTQERSLIGAAHLSANDLGSIDNVRQSLQGLYAEVSDQLDADSNEAIDTAQTYSIGGQDSGDANDLLDYVRLALVLKELNAQMEWRGAVMPATAQDEDSHVDARMDSTSVRYSVQTKAMRAPSATPPTMQLQRDKAGRASAKADRRAERQQRGDRGRHEARRQEAQVFDPGGIGHAPMGDVGVMLTMLMLLGQIHGAGAQPLSARDPRSQVRPSPAHQPEVQGNSTALAPQRPGQVALPQGGLPPMSPARPGTASMGLLPFNTSMPHARRSSPTNSTGLTTLPQTRQPEPSLIKGPHNTTSAHPLLVPSGTPRNLSNDMCAINETGMAIQSEEVAYGTLAHVRCDPLVETLCGEVRSNPVYNGTLSEVDRVCKDIQITDPINKPGACVFNARGDGAGDVSCKVLDSYDDSKIGHELEHAVDSCFMQQGGGSLGQNYWGVVSEIHAHTVQAAIAKNNHENGLNITSRDRSLMNDFDSGCVMPSSASKLDNVDSGMWAILHMYHKLYVKDDLSLQDLQATYGKEMAKARARYTDMTQSSDYISSRDPRYKAIK